MPGRTAILYRMVLPDHVCPYGLLAKRMLEDAGYEVEDRQLTSREEVDAFKAEHAVQTTPQACIDGKWIGGSDDLADYLESTEASA